MNNIDTLIAFIELGVIALVVYGVRYYLTWAKTCEDMKRLEIKKGHIDAEIKGKEMDMKLKMIDYATKKLGYKDGVSERIQKSQSLDETMDILLEDMRKASSKPKELEHKENEKK